jgi:CubicO group peptidase (beta-lactamase class C family)
VRALRQAFLSAILFSLICTAAAGQTAPPRGLTQSAPESIGLLSGELKKIDAVVNAAIQAKEIPGAVVLVARKGRIGYFRAFGQRAVLPAPEPMTLDTVFDMASLTKVMATSPAVMTLVDRGDLRLDDRVKRYLPKFVGNGKDSITLRQLLTHYSGLRPDFDLSKEWFGTAATMEELWLEKTQSDPGKEFVYSDLNFIALGEVVHTVTGKTLDAYVREAIFEPLGMSDTRYTPPPDWKPRIAPTEPRARTLAYLKGEGAGSPPEILRGEVHDPTAWRMEGVAGHAGLFSSAKDVAVYAQMLLNHGTFQGKRILSQAAVTAMISPQSPRGLTALRGFGWDIETSYSSPRGDLFPGGFGHTGFTGTSLWVHPQTETFIVILSNRVHPDGKGDATHLRGVVANVVASALADLR